MKIKLILKKFLVCMMLIVLLFNFICTPKVHAGASDIISSGLGTIINILPNTNATTLAIYYGIKVLVVAVCGAALMIIGGVAKTFGYVDDDGNYSDHYYKVDENGNKQKDDIVTLSLADIFFNKLLLTDINIFNVDLNNGNSVNEATPIVKLRSQIALWYYIMRLIAIAILLAILVFVAIKMAIATVATEKAHYKKMLIDWASSIALVFLMHYVIVLIIKLNNISVKMIANIAADSLVSGDSIFTQLTEMCFQFDMALSIGACIVLFMLISQTLAFLIMYVKRMLTISFLIIISPLITITYSIDRMGDGKAQALNAWIKEFVFSVIIQPFHCIMYLAFSSITLGLLQTNNWLYHGGGMLGAAVLACMCTQFIWSGEKIVKQIFGIKVSESIGDAVASAAIAGTVLSKATSLATKAPKGVSTAMKLGGKFGGGFGQRMKDLSNAMDSTLGKTKVGKILSAPVALPVKGMAKAVEKSEKFGQSIKEMKTNLAKTKIGQVGASISSFYKLPEGQQYFRKIAKTSVGVAAGIMTAGISYGSSEKASMITSIGAGITTGTALGDKAGQLVIKKYEHFDEKASVSKEILNGIEKTTGENISTYEDMSTNAKAYKNEDAYNKDDMDKHKNSSKSQVKAILKDHYDKLLITKSDDDLEKEAKRCLNQFSADVVTGDMNLDEWAKNFGIDKNELLGALGDWGKLRVLQNHSQDMQDFNDLTGSSSNAALNVSKVMDKAENDKIAASQTKAKEYFAESSTTGTSPDPDDATTFKGFAEVSGDSTKETAFDNAIKEIKKLLLALGKDITNQTQRKEVIDNLLKNSMRNPELLKTIHTKDTDAQYDINTEKVKEKLKDPGFDLANLIITEILPHVPGYASLSESDKIKELMKLDKVKEIIYMDRNGSAISETKPDGTNTFTEKQKIERFETIVKIQENVVYENIKQTGIVDVDLNDK